MNHINGKSIYDNITIIIVTFKSHHIIDKCLKNLDENLKKILIENSDDIEFTKNLKEKYKNLECINMGLDTGFGYALNTGIRMAKTDFIISVNPDSFPDKDCFEKLANTAKSDQNIAFVVPLTLLKNGTTEFTAYGYFSSKRKFLKDNNNHIYVDWVNGNVFLLNKKNMKDIGYFDENIFLDFDEIDLQHRIFKAGKKTVINFDAKSKHLEGKSADPKYAFEMKCELSWHHAWSKYYYYKKHFGILYSIYICLPFAFIHFLKFVIYFILKDKKKSKIYRLFFLGFFNSLLNKKSFYRADID